VITLGQIVEKTNGPQIEMHSAHCSHVSEFQFNRDCFQRQEANANFDVTDNIVSTTPTQAQLTLSPQRD